MKKEEKNMQNKTIEIDFNNIKDRSPALATVDLLADEIKIIISKGDDSLNDNECGVIAFAHKGRVNRFAIGGTRDLLLMFINLIKQHATENNAQAKKILEVAGTILLTEADKYD